MKRIGDLVRNECGGIGIIVSIDETGGAVYDKLFGEFKITRGTLSWDVVIASLGDADAGTG